MTMQCPELANVQCSGPVVQADDAGIAITRSGVQVWGASTTDLLPVNPDVTNALGLTLRTGAPAEVRIDRDAGGVPGSATLLLDNLGLSWDSVRPRPRIIETFRTQQGRVQLDANELVTAGALPLPSNLAFYDFASRGSNGTQANYANNIYFPRLDLPPRCPPGMTPCLNVETSGFTGQAGDWRFGGTSPDEGRASRMHEDGDVHAGDGETAPLPGSSGPGIPFPGSKGYRNLRQWKFVHANLAAWFTQDTINIAEWTGGSGDAPEHNKNRRGLVAFGEVTAPAAVPARGQATYRAGFVYGWYAAPWTAPDRPSDALPFRGQATVTLDLEARIATITVSGLRNEDTDATLPVEFTSTATLGPQGGNASGYFRGPVDTGAMSGSVGGRLFGPITATAGAATPPEVGGVFRIAHPTSGAALVGGFIARK